MDLSLNLSPFLWEIFKLTFWEFYEILNFLRKGLAI